MSKRSKRKAFTLVELLVAIALGTILIGLVTFIWMQSTRIFSSTVNNLESYQRLRGVLDLVERDLANTNRTIDMEFYDDINPNGHRDESPAEPLLAHSAAGGGAVAAGSPGASFRRPVDPLDPLFGQPEFCELDNPSNLNFSDTPYFYAPILFSPPPYAIAGEGYLEGRQYWRDEVYVRSFVDAGGASVPALVHYRLVQQANGRSALRRRAWWTDESGAVVAPGPTVTDATDRTAVLATGICDLKFAFFYKPSTASGGSSTEGHWYHVGCPVSSDGGALELSDRERGIRSAIGLPEFQRTKTKVGTANAISFVYEGVGRIEQTEAGPPLFRTLKEPSEGGNGMNSGAPSAGMADYQNFDFPGVRPGDKIYLYDARDDDGSSIDPDGSGPAAAEPANDYAAGIVRFKDGTYTVDEIISQSNPGSGDPFFVGVKLREPVNFYQLGRRWLIGPSPGVGEPTFSVDISNMGPKGGPPRVIRSAFNVRYRVAFLPPAFLVRISLDDSYNKKVHQIERVVRLLQH